MGLPRMYCEKEKVRGEKEMSEKVLGFKESFLVGGLHGGKVIFKIDGLVPVRLKSESVDLKWLIDYCEKQLVWDGWDFVKAINIDVDDLLCAVRAKAEDGKK